MSKVVTNVNNLTQITFNSTPYLATYYVLHVHEHYTCTENMKTCINKLPTGRPVSREILGHILRNV